MKQWRFIALLLTVGLSLFAQQSSMSLDEMRDLIKQIGAPGGLSEQQAISIIERRRLGFVSTDDIEAELTRAGAKGTLIDVVRRIAPAPRGTLSVHCAPVDCEVSINRRPLGSSKNGSLTQANVGVGEVNVEVSRSGYASQALKATIVQNRPAELNVTLVASEATKAANGAALLKSMSVALGADDNPGKLNSFYSIGRFTIYSGGKEAGYSLELDARAPAILEVKTTTGQQNVVMKCDGDACEVKPKKLQSTRIKTGGKSPPAEIIAQIESNWHTFTRYSLPAVLRAISDSGVRLSALSAEPVVGKDLHLTADTGDGVYDVTVGSDLLPTQVGFTPKSGLGAGRTVFYARYADIPTGGQYPTVTTVKIDKDGIEVSLSKLEAQSGK